MFICDFLLSFVTADMFIETFDILTLETNNNVEICLQNVDGTLRIWSHGSNTLEKLLEHFRNLQHTQNTPKIEFIFNPPFPMC